MLVDCPDCGKAVKERGLGPHRRLAHGYRLDAGSDAHLIAPGGDGLYRCPECGPGSQVFKTPTGLGKHRSALHGIAGSSRAARSMRKRNQVPKPATRYCALGRHKACVALFGGFAPCGCKCHATKSKRPRTTVTATEQPTAPSARRFSETQA